MEDYKKMADKLKNDLLIKRTVKEHLKIEDKEAQEKMEKLLIYNLMN